MKSEYPRFSDLTDDELVALRWALHAYGGDDGSLVKEILAQLATRRETRRLDSEHETSEDCVRKSAVTAWKCPTFNCPAIFTEEFGVEPDPALEGDWFCCECTKTTPFSEWIRGTWVEV